MGEAGGGGSQAEGPAVGSPVSVWGLSGGGGLLPSLGPSSVPHPPEHLLPSSANMERLGEVSLWFPNIRTKVRQSHSSETLLW